MKDYEKPPKKQRTRRRESAWLLYFFKTTMSASGSVDMLEKSASALGARLCLLVEVELDTFDSAEEPDFAFCELGDLEGADPGSRMSGLDLDLEGMTRPPAGLEEGRRCEDSLFGLSSMSLLSLCTKTTESAGEGD